MIWKLYKKTAKLLIRCCLLACYRGDVSMLIEKQLSIINSISRIAAEMQLYREVHPQFAQQQYGNLNDFLYQRLAKADWQFWNQLQTHGSANALRYIERRFEMA